MIQLSVIIPFYNSSEYFEESLESLKVNLNEEIEVLLIDDGSTDNSLEIINKVFNETPDRIKTLFRPIDRPKGANACRNYGLEHANGQWVMFLDSDDLLSSTCILDRMCYINQNKKCDMYIFQTGFINNEKVNIGLFSCNINMTIDEMVLCFLEHKVLWHTMSVVWNRNYLRNIGGWNEMYPRLQDVELNIRALLKNVNIHIFEKERVDSFYRYLPLNEIKRNAARYGFVMLLHDYYPVVMKRFKDENIRDKILDIFQKKIISLLGDYMQSECIDEEWCNLFLKTLEVCEMDREEILEINFFFKRKKE
ncbi:MAG: glycosyltransferase family 2 protein [Flavobacteriaceae bacterium]|jgi:glycosyltransferase involved in cell wall biosynthesis|nr:glycosyltransferase family 2 protein [Flavobacteriaceae bacterium]